MTDQTELDKALAALDAAVRLHAGSRLDASAFTVLGTAERFLEWINEKS